MEQLGEGITALRGLISELRPAALDELGLAAAIEGLIEQQANAGELEIDAEVALEPGEDGEAERLDPELESTLYRVVQEALTNIVKHARAERVRLVLREVDGWIEVMDPRRRARLRRRPADRAGSACWACASGSSWPTASWTCAHGRWRGPSSALACRRAAAQEDSSRLRSSA